MFIRQSAEIRHQFKQFNCSSAHFLILLLHTVDCVERRSLWAAAIVRLIQKFAFSFRICLNKYCNLFHQKPVSSKHPDMPINQARIFKHYLWVPTFRSRRGSSVSSKHKTVTGFVVGVKYEAVRSCINHCGMFFECWSSNAVKFSGLLVQSLKRTAVKTMILSLKSKIYWKKSSFQTTWTLYADNHLIHHTSSYNWLLHTSDRDDASVCIFTCLCCNRKF